ncbi:MAG: hypothetical protein KC619_26770 [Myxococcales bacterium]|nr:hypothetical protein [Myxococcales bacterium]
MKVGRQISMLTWLLVAVQVITSLAGIAMLERMSPAIGRILRENVESVHAVESMLAILTVPTIGASERQAFEAALAAAEGNVTEPEEPDLLARIRERSDAALAGDPGARADVVVALTELGAINRAAMGQADEEALRLGSAGRWALAFLALVGFAASLLSIRRAGEQLLAPLAEMVAVVTAFRQGDTHRRCQQLPPNELSDVLDHLDLLLDRAEHAMPAPVPHDERPRGALLALLDRMPRPALVLGEDGSVIAASQSALDRLTESDEALLDRLREGETREGETIERHGGYALALL